MPPWLYGGFNKSTLDILLIVLILETGGMLELTTYKTENYIMPKNLHGSKRNDKKSSGVKKNRAGKNVPRDGRPVNMSKADKRAMSPTWPTDEQKAEYYAFTEKDRRDRRGRMKRLNREQKVDTIDRMKTPLLEKALSTMEDAQTLQKLFIAAALKFVPKKGWPFFYIKRTAKLGRRPIEIM